MLLLELILRAWAVRAGRDVFVARNLDCRTDPSDARLGIDPDIALIEPPPPHLDTLKQLRLWEPGHVAPWLGIEVVSESTRDDEAGASLWPTAAEQERAAREQAEAEVAELHRQLAALRRGEPR